MQENTQSIQFAKMLMLLASKNMIQAACSVYHLPNCLQMCFVLGAFSLPSINTFESLYGTVLVLIKLKQNQKCTSQFYVTTCVQFLNVNINTIKQEVMLSCLKREKLWNNLLVVINMILKKITLYKHNNMKLWM